MGNGIMAQDKKKGRVAETVVLIVVALCILLVLMELGGNVVAALLG